MSDQKDIRFIPELGFDRDKVQVIHGANHADLLIDHVLNLLEESGNLKPCANKPTSKQKRRVTLESLLANLILSTSDDFELDISTRKHVYYSRRDGHYRNYPVDSSFSQEEKLRIIDALQVLGLILHEKADRAISGLGISSRFIVTEKMFSILQTYPVSVLALSFNSPLVIVKDEEKNIMKRLPRDIAKQVAPLEDQMKRIRDFMSWQGIELIDYDCKNVTLEVLAKVAERNRTKNDKDSDDNGADNKTCGEQGLEDDFSHYDTSAKALRQKVYPYRIFNNGSTEQGGRMFGHWIQRISKDDRKLAVLNDHQTIGLDWSAVHPHIIYALAGKPVPGGDIYELDGIDNFNDKIAKKLMLIVFNCKNRNAAILAMLKHDKKRAKQGKAWGLTRDVVNEYIDALIRKHSSIADYFFSGVGLKAQNIESNMAVSVVEKLMDQDMACIPIHDCFIVGVQNREALARAMDEAAEETIGRRIPWKQEY